MTEPPFTGCLFDFKRLCDGQHIYTKQFEFSKQQGLVLQKYNKQGTGAESAILKHSKCAQNGCNFGSYSPQNDWQNDVSQQDLQRTTALPSGLLSGEKVRGWSRNVRIPFSHLYETFLSSLPVSASLSLSLSHSPADIWKPLTSVLWCASSNVEQIKFWLHYGVKMRFDCSTRLLDLQLKPMAAAIAQHALR